MMSAENNMRLRSAAWPSIDRSRKILAAAALTLSLFAGSALAQTPAGTIDPVAAVPAPTVESPPSAAAAVESPQGAKAADESVRLAPPADASLPSALPNDLSPWGMFLHANLIVKLVMSGLAFASLVTWTIWLAKTLELWTAQRSARRDLKTLAGAASLSAAEASFAESATPVARFVRAAVGEEERSSGLPAEGVKERVAALLSRLEAHAGRKMARGTAIIATIGSTAPFVGLFGTVWGIMDSFIGISKTHTTNLAVVAPGIAEALLATATGLVAAIPAVMIYNGFARAITGYKARLGDASAEVLRHVSRDLDRRDADRTPAAPAKDEAHVIAMRRSAE
ncbi:Biopolymer transport protein ExbB [Methylocella tundrae]|uniref:Biopolymer transport protein ExbB n=2 Tax=Methylocella tundrae TaxID=227605 RepID=A0A8B6M4V6_METTU|nr:Biopolymer transport protein ExbB [Methylocella tundrae]VTZ49878.1 Biopolymer transport protein ExbB [Methylocella tundrae]